MPTPKVTVLMTVYYGEKYLQKAIDSILNQSYKDFELIIIDDASLDSTQSILKSQNDPRIRLIINDHNIGITKSVNKGLSTAKGEYIARMDADDISLPNRLTTQLQFFNHHPEFAAIGCSAYIIDDNTNIIGIRREKKIVTFHDLLSRCSFVNGSTMIKKQILDEVAGYNEDLFLAEDYDLWLRISKNHIIGNLPGILYQLRLHNESITKRKAEESALYHIFVQKIAKNEISDLVYKKVKNNIHDILQYLDKNDLFFLYGARSEHYVEKSDLINARLQYKKRFFLKYKPLDLIDYVLTFFGIDFMNKSKKIRRSILNWLIKMNYYFE